MLNDVEQWDMLLLYLDEGKTCIVPQIPARAKVLQLALPGEKNYIQVTMQKFMHNPEFLSARTALGLAGRMLRSTR